MAGFGLMFHHFYDATVHPKGQGALSSDDFDDLLDDSSCEILSADEWRHRLQDGTLASDQACLTFDDGLKCQYDIALPVLEARGLKAFWFPYTAPLAGERDHLELYRYFRTVCFPDVETFYLAFDDACKESPYAEMVGTGLDGFVPGSYLADYTFYSDGDRRFRFVRDQILGQQRFFAVMDAMLEANKFDLDSASDHLWMGVKELADLLDLGHMIGLHSHSHPTNITELSREDQSHEFDTNAKWLYESLGHQAESVSYPCGAYDSQMISMLSDRGIRIGFQSRMGPSEGAMTVPRLDHAIALERLAARRSENMET